MSGLFNVDFETGDTSQFTSVTDPDADLNVTTPGMAGTGNKLSITIDDTASAFGIMDFAVITSRYLRVRFYVNKEDLTMANLDLFKLWAAERAGGADRHRIEFRNSGGNFQFRAHVRTDAGSYVGTSYRTLASGDNLIEVRYERASTDVASDGTVQTWLNEVAGTAATGLDVFDVTQPDGANFGAFGGVDAGTSGTLVLDEYVMRDDDTAIGPVVLGADNIALLLRRRRRGHAKVGY